METVKIGVTGGTPGADSNDYTLFDSTVSFPGGLQAFDISRIIFAINSSGTGTLKAYFSMDKGTNWTLYNQQSVAAYSSPTAAGPYDYAVDLYPDWRLIWTNGGSAQTTWRVSLVGIRNYHGPAA